MTSNTAGTLTVAAQTGDSTTGISDGDTVELSEAWTLGTLLGDSLPAGTELLAFSGSGTGQNVAADVIYGYGQPFGGVLFPNGPEWYNTAGYAESSNVFLYPGEGLILRANATPISSFTLSGSVPIQTNRSIILGGSSGQDTPISFPSPVDEVIVDMNLPVASGDELLVFDPSSSGQNKAAAIVYGYGQPFDGVLFPNGPEWYNTQGFAQLANETIPAGSSFVYRRNSAADDTAWSDDAGYNQP